MPEPTTAGLGDAAQEALYAFVSQSLAFLVPGDRNKVPEWVASGTFFSTAAGRAAVLTAKHNLERADREPLRLGYFQCTNVLEDVAAAIANHPDRDVDVGLVALKRAPAEAVASHVLPLSSIAEADEVTNDDALILGGFLSTLTLGRQTDRPERPPLVELAFKSITYGTALQDPPLDQRGRFRVAWTEMEVPGSEPRKMPDPKGISGGGFWRFRGVGKRAVWHPQKAGRLVGIPISFWDPTGTEDAEPVSRWRDWFLETLQQLDEAVP